MLEDLGSYIQVANIKFLGAYRIRVYAGCEVHAKVIDPLGGTEPTKSVKHINKS